MEAEPPKADQRKRKRRWYQFSLRSLLLGVAVFCAMSSAVVSLRDQAEIVQERDVMLSKCGITGNGDTLGSKGGIPWYRRLRGDRPINCVLLDISTPNDEVERYRTIFPEANVYLLSDHSAR